MLMILVLATIYNLMLATGLIGYFGPEKARFMRTQR